jgi:hypothetical protein
VPKGSPTSVEDASRTSITKIFPNPGDKVLYIESNGDEFAIFSLSGTKVKGGKLGGRIHMVEIDDLAPGTYILKVIAKTGGTSGQKIVKQ